MTPHPPLPWFPFSHWRRLGITPPRGRENTVVIRNVDYLPLILLIFSTFFRYSHIEDVTANYGFGRATLPRGRVAVSLLQWEKVARLSVAKKPVTDEVSPRLYRVMDRAIYTSNNNLFSCISFNLYTPHLPRRRRYFRSSS